MKRVVLISVILFDTLVHQVSAQIISDGNYVHDSKGKQVYSILQEIDEPCNATIISIDSSARHYHLKVDGRTDSPLIEVNASETHWNCGAVHRKTQCPADTDAAGLQKRSQETAHLYCLSKSGVYDLIW